MAVLYSVLQVYVFELTMIFVSCLSLGLQFEGVSIPMEVKEQLLIKFTERQEGMSKGGKTLHTLSHRMKDKIRLHLCVLTLILDDFTVDCLPLQQDLKLTTTK